MQSHERSPIYTSAILSGPICGMLDIRWEEVLTRAGIIATERNDRAFLVSAEEYLRLWAAIMDLSGQQDVSKLLGLRMAGGPAIPVLFALSTAPDFETGIMRMAKFKSLFGPMQFVLSHLGAVFALARPALGMELDQQAMKDAFVVCSHLGITGKGRSRDRRPTLKELDALLTLFEQKHRHRPSSLPMHRVMSFALFSTRRQEEITRIT
jgi:hypothetical protein